MDGGKRLAWAVGIGVASWCGFIAAAATSSIPDEPPVETTRGVGVEVGGAVSIEDESERPVVGEPADGTPEPAETVTPIIALGPEKPGPAEAEPVAPKAAPATTPVTSSITAKDTTDVEEPVLDPQAATGDAASGEPAGDAPAEARAASLEATPVPAREALPLGSGDARDEGGAGLGMFTSDGLGVARTVGAVAAVIVLILVARFLIGRVARLGGVGLRGQLGAGGRSPSGIVQILGRYPVSRGHTLVLMKLDRRVLLLSQTATGFSTLSEITDADDVASILSKSRDEEGESLTARFGAMLRRLERDPEMGRADDVEIAPYLRRPSLDELEGFEDGARGAPGGDGFGRADDELETDDAGAALRRRLEGLRGLSA